MMWRRIAVLATLWLVLIIGPALVAARLLAVATDTSQKGWVLGVWVGGYLAQILVFRAIARRSPRPVGVGWLVASAAPWAADWTAPLSWWGVAVCAVIVTAYGAWLVAAAYRVDRLRSGNVRGSALVLEAIRPALNGVVSKDSARRTLRVRVERADGAPPYEARLTTVFTLGEIPEAGDRLAVLIDPADAGHVEPIPDLPVQRAAPVPENLDAEVAERLRTLATMRDRGDLTDAEFARAKDQLLDS